MNLRLKEIPYNSDRLILNHIYEVKPVSDEYTSPFIIEIRDKLYEVFNEGISMGLYNREFFDTISDFREQQIDDILLRK